MKCIVVSSNTSGGGKTTVTLGLLKALKNRGYKTQSYKVGPDYIDNAFHSHITGIPGRNLDLHLMGEDGVKASFSRGTGDIGIVEGVMGLYDGIDITPKYSTAHVAEVLNLPIVLVLTPKAQVATLCAEINGMKSFGKVNIAGIILNNISEDYYKLLKMAIELQCNTKVFGYLPSDESLSLKSRHLGLIQSSEIEDLDNKIDLCANLLEKYVNIDELMEYFTEARSYKDEFHINNMGLRTAIAYDKAFSFYYRENIELLKEAGEVTFFSPIKDKRLPENIDFIYLGGGYPEVFINELSGNIDMLHSIKSALENGSKCYAECGGLMYLTNEIEGKETVGFLKGKSFMTDRLQNFGYASIEVTSKNPMLAQGTTINCHEFHKSNVSIDEDKIYTLTKAVYDGSIKKWTCGYLKNNTLAAYGHVHFFGNMNMLNNLLSKTTLFNNY